MMSKTIFVGGLVMALAATTATADTTMEQPQRQQSLLERGVKMLLDSSFLKPVDSNTNDNRARALQHRSTTQRPPADTTRHEQTDDWNDDYFHYDDDGAVAGKGSTHDDHYYQDDDHHSTSHSHDDDYYSEDHHHGKGGGHDDDYYLEDHHHGKGGGHDDDYYSEDHHHGKGGGHDDDYYSDDHHHGKGGHYDDDYYYGKGKGKGKGKGSKKGKGKGGKGGKKSSKKGKGKGGYESHDDDHYEDDDMIIGNPRPTIPLFAEAFSPPALLSVVPDTTFPDPLARGTVYPFGNWTYDPQDINSDVITIALGDPGEGQALLDAWVKLDGYCTRTGTNSNMVEGYCHFSYTVVDPENGGTIGIFAADGPLTNPGLSSFPCSSLTVTGGTSIFQAASGGVNFCPSVLDAELDPPLVESIPAGLDLFEDVDGYLHLITINLDEELILLNSE